MMKEYTPHKYQEFATEFILQNPIAAIFLSMGLGKTVITLTAIEMLLHDSFEVSRVLIIAPLRSHCWFSRTHCLKTWG